MTQDNTQMVELLPCPFCGGEPSTYAGQFASSVKCDNGHAIHVYSNTGLAAAIAAWNARHTPEPATAPTAIGKWLCAALEDPNACEELKADIRAWFAAGEPGPATALVEALRPELFENEDEVWLAARDYSMDDHTLHPAELIEFLKDRGLIGSKFAPASPLAEAFKAVLDALGKEPSMDGWHIEPVHSDDVRAARQALSTLSQDQQP